MANAVRVRVELKQYNHNPSYDEREIAFKKLFTAFKKQCQEAGVMKTHKQKERFESNARKRRRKKRESELQQLKAKLNENFTSQGKKHEQK